jgi:hypothetical protein
MGVLTHDCAHCGAHRATFSLLAEHLEPRRKLWSVFGVCPACQMGMVFLVHVLKNHGQGAGVKDFRGDIAATHELFLVVNAWPEPPTHDVPAHLPDRVARAFGEGCKVLSASPSAACAQFRKALEFGLKDLAPEIEAWKLEKRIDKLANEGKLTRSLQEWAHQLRLDGNEAVHGDDDPSLEHAQAVEKLTRFVLTYLYTLPKNIEQARAEEGN